MKCRVSMPMSQCRVFDMGARCKIKNPSNISLMHFNTIAFFFFLGFGREVQIFLSIYVCHSLVPSTCPTYLCTPFQDFCYYFEFMGLYLIRQVVAFLGVLVYNFYGEELREMFGYAEHPYAFYTMAGKFAYNCYRIQIIHLQYFSLGATKLH